MRVVYFVLDASETLAKTAAFGYGAYTLFEVGRFVELYIQFMTVGQ